MEKESPRIKVLTNQVKVETKDTKGSSKGPV